MVDRHGSVVLLLLGAVCAAAACGPGSDATASGDAAVDRSRPVILLDYEGGYRPPRQAQDDASLRVFADGTVLLGSSGGLLRPVRERLEPQRLEALLREILEDDGFLSIDSAAVERDLTATDNAAEGRIRGPLVDAPVARVRVAGADGVHEVRFAGLAERALRHPEIAALQRLERVRRRLERLRSEIYAGGPAGVREWLALANRELAARHPEVSPLVEGDLESAAGYATGRTVVTFSGRQVAGAKVRRVLVRIDAPEEGQPQVDTRVEPDE